MIYSNRIVILAINMDNRCTTVLLKDKVFSM